MRWKNIYTTRYSSPVKRTVIIRRGTRSTECIFKGTTSRYESRGTRRRPPGTNGCDTKCFVLAGINNAETVVPPRLSSPACRVQLGRGMSNAATLISAMGERSAGKPSVPAARAFLGHVRSLEISGERLPDRRTAGGTMLSSRARGEFHKPKETHGSA